VPINSLNPSLGNRTIIFEKEFFIERSDFLETPPKDFWRLSPKNEVRLRYAYLVKCEEFIKDKNGNIKEIHVVYDPESLGGKSSDGRKVKGIIHWVA